MFSKQLTLHCLFFCLFLRLLHFEFMFMWSIFCHCSAPMWGNLYLMYPDITNSNNMSYSINRMNVTLNSTNDVGIEELSGWCWCAIAAGHLLLREKDTHQCKCQFGWIVRHHLSSKSLLASPPGTYTLPLGSPSQHLSCETI